MTPGPFSPFTKSPSMDDVSDDKDVKIRELEDTIKVLMEKLNVCGNDVQTNGVDHKEEEVVKDTVE